MSKHKLVPVEPTPEMERAAESYWNERRFKGLSDDPRTWAGVYQAMLSAAPAVQGEPECGCCGQTVKCDDDCDAVVLRKAEQQPDVTQLVEALEEGLRAIGDHHAPGDCYATGPMTGDPFRDLVQCPACSFIAMCDDLLAAYRKGEES